MEYPVSENEILMTAAAIRLDHGSGAAGFAEQRAQEALGSGNLAMHRLWIRVRSAITDLDAHGGAPSPAPVHATEIKPT